MHRELIDALELAAANVRAVGEAELEAPPVELDLLQGQRIQVVERQSRPLASTRRAAGWPTPPRC